MDQIVDTAPALPILDVPVPLMGEQLVDVLHFFNTLFPVAEQVIDVPKISQEPCASLVSCATAGGTAGGSADGPNIRFCSGL